MSRYIRKSHNVSILLYHLVCPAKYRRVIFDAVVDYTLKDICLEIAKRYEIEFLEIGTDRDHVHFLVQSVPSYSLTKIVRTIKSITARRVRALHPEVRKELWGGKFWSEGYFAATVGRHGTEEVIQRYVNHPALCQEAGSGGALPRAAQAAVEFVWKRSGRQRYSGAWPGVVHLCLILQT